MAGSREEKREGKEEKKESKEEVKKTPLEILMDAKALITNATSKKFGTREKLKMLADAEGLFRQAAVSGNAEAQREYEILTNDASNLLNLIARVDETVFDAFINELLDAGQVDKVEKILSERLFEENKTLLRERFSARFEALRASVASAGPPIFQTPGITYLVARYASPMDIPDRVEDPVRRGLEIVERKINESSAKTSSEGRRLLDTINEIRDEGDSEQRKNMLLAFTAELRRVVTAEPSSSSTSSMVTAPPPDLVVALRGAITEIESKPEIASVIFPRGPAARP